jgi:hypothetical protein
VTSADPFSEAPLAGRLSADEGPGEAGQLPPRRIDLTNEVDAVRNLRRALVHNAVPDIYARRGALVQVTEVAGLAVDELPYVSALPMDPHSLRRLVGKHAYAFRSKPVKRKEKGPDGKAVEIVDWVEIEAAPPVLVCKDLLSETEWRDLPALRGVSLTPILRPDGTLVQDKGYDEQTGIYYAPMLTLDHVPTRPMPHLVEQARTFVLDDVLGDFPWVDKGDKANYLALLITPLLRTYLRGALSPLGAITAANAGTGKTLLAGDIPQALYGITSRAWVGDDAELHKSITTVLMASTKPVVLFDNVPEGEPIKSAKLAKLLTSHQWDDRELGKNGAGSALEAINDRLWLATGNAMAFGGDMPSRTVLVRLDANMARPDLRSGFKIPDLQAWLTDPANAAELLYSLLVLIMDWIAADREGARPYTMRQFARWATACGDFLAHHGVPLFLDNASAIEAADDERGEWLAFLDEWHKRFGTDLKTAVEVAKSAETTYAGMEEYDPWGGRFLKDGRGRNRNSISLGRQLRAHKGRVFAVGPVGGYKIESPDRLERDNVRRYRVVIVGDEGTLPADEADAAEPAGQGAAAPLQRPATRWDADDRTGNDAPAD